MSKWIDADALNIDFYDEYETEDDEYTYAYVSKAQIDSAPTIDAVSVVRCKECKHNPWNYDAEKPLEYTCIWDDDFADREQTPNDFCSYGERKGE